MECFFCINILMENVYKTKVSIHKYNVSFNRGLRLIDKFKKINNIDFKFELKIDFREYNLGYFLYNKDENVIYINPLKCTNKEKNDLLGHSADCSIFSTIIHELGHFLDQYYKLTPKYLSKNFALKHLYLTFYGHTEIIEQIADLITIYLINPYYLKLIDIERYEWLKTKFKSPSPCGIKTFMKFYNRWSNDVQQAFLKDYNITL